MLGEVKFVVASCLSHAGGDAIAYGSALFPYMVKRDRG
jgi:hypothetical protein